MGGEAPWLRESLGIVDNVLNRQVAKVRTGDALGHLHVTRMRDAGLVNPCNVILSDRFHHQRVAFPMPYGIAEPGLLHLRIMRTPVQEDLAPYVGSAFIDDH